MADIPKITYVNGRGLAEVSRLIFAVNDVKITEEYLTTKAHYESLKATGKLAFQQIPLIEIDGQCLVESNAQANYLGLKYNMLGNTNEERAQVQILYCGAMSFHSVSSPAVWLFQAEEKREDNKAAAIGRAKNRYLPAFEKAFEKSGTGFLVGDKATIADCALFNILSYFVELTDYGTVLDDKPRCKAFVTKFGEIASVKNYINGPRRFPPPDEVYVKNVKATLF